MNEDFDIERLFGNASADDAPRAEHQARLREEMLSAFDDAQQRPRVVRVSRVLFEKGRRIMLHPVSRWTAVAAAGVLLAWLFIPATQSTAFAGLLEPMLNAKTARFKITAKAEGIPGQTFAGYFRAPNSYRQEAKGAITIADFDRGLMTTLMPDQKRAMIFEHKGPEPKESGNYFGNLREFLKKYGDKSNAESFHDLGKKEIDGRAVFGFRIENFVQTVTLWGDAETGRLFRLEAVMPGPPKTEVVMTDMEFDVALDESLFNATPPADYQVSRLEMDVSKPTEMDFIEALRTCLDLTGGEFPTGFDGAAMGAMFGKSFAKDLGKNDAKAKEPTAEQIATLMKQSVAIGRGLSFAMLQGEADGHYAGKGVKKSDPKRPIFWYKPKDATKYRVIQSDLSVDETEAAPKVPGAQPIKGGNVQK